MIYMQTKQLEISLWTVGFFKMMMMKMWQELNFAAIMHILHQNSCILFCVLYLEVEFEKRISGFQ